MRDRFTVGIERGADGRAIKRLPNAAAEFEKAEALEAALAGTAFHVPHPLRCDEQAGLVEFEFVEDTILLQEIIERAGSMRRFHRVLKLNDAAAKLLATLHRRLTLPRAHDWQPPDYLTQSVRKAGLILRDEDQVFLHCDYSPVNLLVDRENKMTVIDASPNSYFTDYPLLRGHRLVDVAGYTTKLDWPYRLRSHSFTWRKMARMLRRRFLAVYERVAEVSIDRRLHAAFESAVVRSFVEWKTTNPLVRATALSVDRVVSRRPN